MGLTDVLLLSWSKEKSFRTSIRGTRPFFIDVDTASNQQHGQ